MHIKVANTYGTSAAGGIVSVNNNRPTQTQEGYAILETGNYDSAVKIWGRSAWILPSRMRISLPRAINSVTR